MVTVKYIQANLWVTRHDRSEVYHYFEESGRKIRASRVNHLVRPTLTGRTRRIPIRVLGDAENSLQITPECGCPSEIVDISRSFVMHISKDCVSLALMINLRCAGLDITLAGKKICNRDKSTRRPALPLINIRIRTTKVVSVFVSNDVSVNAWTNYRDGDFGKRPG